MESELCVRPPRMGAALLGMVAALVLGAQAAIGAALQGAATPAALHGAATAAALRGAALQGAATPAAGQGMSRGAVATVVGPAAVPAGKRGVVPSPDMPPAAISLAGRPMVVPPPGGRDEGSRRGKEGAGRSASGAGEASPVLAMLAREHPELPEDSRRAIAAAIEGEARRHRLDPWLIYAVIDVESDFDPRSVGSAGERGLMQVLPSTARAVLRLPGVREGLAALAVPAADLPADLLFDPAVNIRLATAYLAWIMDRHGGDLGRALTEYNTGRVRGAPNRYALKVMARYRAYAASATEGFRGAS